MRRLDIGRGKGSVIVPTVKAAAVPFLVLKETDTARETASGRTPSNRESFRCEAVVAQSRVWECKIGLSSQVSAAAITNGQLWAWGWNALSNSAITVPARLGTGTGFTQVSVRDAHGLAIGPGGEVYSWGESTNGALGRSGSRSLPAVVMRP